MLAHMIGDLIDRDLHRIEAVAAYSRSYAATVERKVGEQDTDARAEIANPLKSIEQYDTVLLGSPVWKVRPPMIMTTLLKSHDLSSKTAHPFVTYAVSGLGRTEETYPPAFAAPGSSQPGLAGCRSCQGRLLGTLERPGWGWPNAVGVEGEAGARCRGRPR